MAVKRKPAAVLLRPIAFLLITYPLFSQQFGLHISLLPKAISDMEADIGSESYINVVKKRPAPFQPTPSDLIIGKAEEKFDRGKRAYKLNDPETSRREFDSAVDLMLMASDNPSDRRLYESKLEEMVDAIHRFDLAGLGAGAPPEQAQFEKAPLDDIIEMTFPSDPKIKGKVSEEVKVTASELPLTVNETVLGYINYFSGKGRRTIVAGLERAAAYRPMISRILAEEGVPLREIAEAIGRRVHVPVNSIAADEAARHFGWLGHFVTADLRASSVLTREWLGWNPVQPGLISDLDRGRDGSPG